MVADQLVCARCAHPVSQGRCVACRAARDEMRRQAASIQRVIATVFALLVVLLLVVHLHG